MADVMTAKEYLQQAYYIDSEIDCKLAQVMVLRQTAAKATSAMSITPGGGYDVHRMEATIVRMVDLEAEINGDIDRLVDLKREIAAKIKAVERPEYRIVLERRYLCYESWEQIAVDLGYDIRHIYRIHGEALACIIV
jgi:hypothetical protein